MTQKHLEDEERDRITRLIMRLEFMRDTLSKGYKRTLEQRKIGWHMIAQEASVQLSGMSESVPDVKPAVLPMGSEKESGAQ